MAGRRWNQSENRATPSQLKASTLREQGLPPQLCSAVATGPETPPLDRPEKEPETASFRVDVGKGGARDHILLCLGKIPP